MIFTLAVAICMWLVSIRQQTSSVSLMYLSLPQHSFPGLLLSFLSFCLLSQPALQKQDSEAKGPQGAVRVGMAQGWRRSRQWEWVDCVYFCPLSLAGWEMTARGRGMEKDCLGCSRKHEDVICTSYTFHYGCLNLVHVRSKLSTDKCNC